jgi:hypothetical protein
VVWLRLRTSRNKELLSHTRDIKIYLLLRCICIASQVSMLSLMATCVVTLFLGSFAYVPIKALKASVKARHRNRLNPVLQPANLAQSRLKIASTAKAHLQRPVVRLVL